MANINTDLLTTARKAEEDGTTKLFELLVMRVAGQFAKDKGSWTLDGILGFIKNKLACTTCDGAGTYREWVAQDETQQVCCVSCNGSGMKTK